MSSHRRFSRVLALCVACVVFVSGAGCSQADDPERTPVASSWAPAPLESDGLTYVARAEGEDLLLSTADGDRAFVAGVNIGATTPGHSPGELSPTAEDYRRWFPQIASLGIRSVRVYTVLPPHFYRELRAFNEANPDEPLYLVQGVWIPEERFYETGDLFDPEVKSGFEDEISDAVAAVHGDLMRPRTPGHASGTWTADVSPWLLAWSPGVEWDPTAVMSSDTKNSGALPFDGRYFSSTVEASPTERWLAQMLDHLATEQAARGTSAPVTFTNWPTTDPLAHAHEPLDTEDLVAIDANHIRVADAWPGGYFASYHVYPYYPDFQRHEPAYQVPGDGGVVDPYRAYIADLRRHHAGIPLVVTEFGVPSSSGMAHYGPLGRDQGDHSEQEQMELVAGMLDVIRDTGCSGAYVFEWADEWFKFTWNTIQYELPSDRRSLWRNAWTNEEHFGLLSVDAGEGAPPVIVDGNVAEWEDNGSSTLFEGRGEVRRVRAVKDEAYLYLHIEQRLPLGTTASSVTVGFDVLEGGGRGVPAGDDAGERVTAAEGVDTAADYVVVVRADGTADAYVRADLDQYAVYWGAVRGAVDFTAADLDPSSGVWHRWRLLVNRRQVIPATGEKFAPESFEAGELRRGTGDPESASFDSRASWEMDGADIELRIPWMAVGYSDPSSKQALVVRPDGTIGSTDVGRLGITVTAGADTVKTDGYDWDGWNRAAYHERLKAGIDTFAQAVDRAHRRR